MMPSRLGSTFRWENGTRGFSACWTRNRLVVVTMLLAALATPASAVSRRMIELQVRVQAMSDQAMIMQQSINEGFAAMTQSLKQSAVELATSQKKLARLRQAAQATSQAARSLPRQLAMLTQSSRDLGASMDTIDHRVKVLSTEIGPPIQVPVSAGEAPLPAVLFRNGLEDYDAGRYQLASQEFAQYGKFYSDTDQSPEAQFYLADSEYWAGDYQQALKDFEKMEQQYPATKPATVALKKGLSLLKLGELQAARMEFRHILEQYPNSVEAMDARSALAKPEIEANVGLSYLKH